MKNRMLVGIIIFIILIFSVVILLILNQANSKTTENVEPGNVKIEPTNELIKVNSIADYKTINNCVEKYLKYINEDDKKAVYSILINDYIQNNNITENTAITDKYPSNFFAQTIYKYDSDLTVRTYFVYGIAFNKQENQSKKINVIVKVDINNKAFEIAPLEKNFKEYVILEDNNKVKVKDELKNKIKSVKRNDYNEIEVVNGLRRQRYTFILF